MYNGERGGLCDITPLSLSLSLSLSVITYELCPILTATYLGIYCPILTTKYLFRCFVTGYHLMTELASDVKSSQRQNTLSTCQNIPVTVMPLIRLIPMEFIYLST